MPKVVPPKSGPLDHFWQPNSKLVPPDHFWQPKVVPPCQKWSHPRPILAAKSGPPRPFLAAKSGPLRPFLAAKSGPLRHILDAPLPNNSASVPPSGSEESQLWLLIASYIILTIYSLQVCVVVSSSLTCSYSLLIHNCFVKINNYTVSCMAM